jgi:hypothetical protein
VTCPDADELLVAAVPVPAELLLEALELQAAASSPAAASARVPDRRLLGLFLMVLLRIS